MRARLSARLQLGSVPKASTRTSEPREHRKGLEFIEIRGIQLHELTVHHDLSPMMHHCRSSTWMVRDSPRTVAFAYKTASQYPIVSTIVPCVTTAARPHGEGKQNEFKNGHLHMSSCQAGSRLAGLGPCSEGTIVRSSLSSPKLVRASCGTIHAIVRWQYASQRILHVVILV
jgi:hypothetical protein